MSGFQYLYICADDAMKAFFPGKGEPIRPFWSQARGTRQDAQSNSILAFIQLNPSAAGLSSPVAYVVCTYTRLWIILSSSRNTCTASKTKCLRRRFNYPAHMVFFIANIHFYNKFAPRRSSRGEALLRDNSYH